MYIMQIIPFFLKNAMKRHKHSFQYLSSVIRNNSYVDFPHIYYAIYKINKNRNSCKNIPNNFNRKMEKTNKVEKIKCLQ